MNKYRLKTLLLLLYIIVNRKKLFEVLSPVSKLILLHTVVVSHYKQLTNWDDWSGYWVRWGGVRAVKMLKYKLHVLQKLIKRYFVYLIINLQLHVYSMQF